MKLRYSVEGLLRKDDRGFFRFKNTIRVDSGSLEVLLKIPKPSQFHRLEMEHAIPVPQMFTEESHYYVLAWDTPTLVSQDVSIMDIDISYRTVWDLESIWTWLLLLFAGAFAGWVLKRILELYLFPSVKQKIETFKEQRSKKSKCSKKGK